MAFYWEAGAEHSCCISCLISPDLEGLMPEQVLNEVQPITASIQTLPITVHSLNSALFLVLFLWCPTYVSTPTVFPCGKLCVVRAAQLEVPPPQLVTGIYCCFSCLLSGVINMHRMLVGLAFFQFCCTFFLFFALANKRKGLVAARNVAIKEKPCFSSTGSVKLITYCASSNIHSGSPHLHCHYVVTGISFTVNSENPVVF